jgi:hypothetical protein
MPHSKQDFQQRDQSGTSLVTAREMNRRNAVMSDGGSPSHSENEFSNYDISGHWKLAESRAFHECPEDFWRGTQPRRWCVDRKSHTNGAGQTPPHIKWAEPSDRCWFGLMSDSFSFSNPGDKLKFVGHSLRIDPPTCDRSNEILVGICGELVWYTALALRGLTPQRKRSPRPK